jgi:branched-chain amino acid transport system substrate-binding protein
MKRRTALMLPAVIGSLAWSGRAARAADEIVVGAIYPLTGNAAQIGADAKAAIETVLEVINGTHPPVPMLMGKGGGLDRMGGAQIRVIFADHQNDPQKARAEAERLITQEHVSTLIGSYTSATAATISQVAERYEVPYISMDNSSPTLSRRGLKWFFRTTPHDEMYSAAMFDYFAYIGPKTGRPVKSVALFYEDSIFGSDSAKVQRDLATAAKMTVAADIKYRANSPSLSAEAQRLKAANADVILPSSYTSDAILLMRSLSEVGYKPPAVMAQGAGFQEQAFLTAAGPLAEGVFSRSTFALDAAKARPAIPYLNDAFRAKMGKDLNDNTGRIVVAVQTLADAINRAGSAKPDDIRKALVATDIPGNQTIMPWKYIKFDETGQNTGATPVIQQVFDGKYVTVFPADVAAREPVWNVGK